MISPRTIVLAVVLLISYVRGEAEYDASEVIDKNPEQLVELRGFGTETHYVRTHDGYYVHVVRIINPLFRSRKLRRPVLFNHGLIESSTILLINARDVTPLDSQCATINEQLLLNNRTSYINGPMMLANHGYDVWLMSHRGTDWSLRHDKYKPEDKEFWNYSLDELTLTDLPMVIDYLREKTGAPKVGYLGHSQGTFTVFGLLAMKPEYADVLEPVIALAPVSYMDHITSAARLLFIGVVEGTGEKTHGSFPPDAKLTRKMLTMACGTSDRTAIASIACKLTNLLIGGKGMRTTKGFWNHMPILTSLKVLRHYGKSIEYKRFMMYDYGTDLNMKIYGTPRSPSYPVDKIRSKSLCLFSTKADTLSPPEDVVHFTSQLSVPPFKNVIIEKDFSHFNLVTDRQAADHVFFPVLKIFEHFEQQAGPTCARMSPLSLDPNSTRLSDDPPSADVPTPTATITPTILGR